METNLGALIKIRKEQYIRELTEGATVLTAFLVKFSAIQKGKTGKAYLNLVLADNTGEVEARVWDDIPTLAPLSPQGAYVWVEGKCQLFQGRRQIVVKRLLGLREDQVDPKCFLKESPLDPEELYKTLIGFVNSMKDPYYKALAESVLIDDNEIVEKFKKAPAAKAMHHAYKTGLLEHVVSIVGILDALSKHYGEILDRDLLFIGGFFHDIGKIWELSYGRTTDYTDEGRLIGHLVMGSELVEKKIRWLEAQTGRLPGSFPEEKRLLAKHVILAHHGILEYGSPKRPKCLEALIVHMVDDMDSKVNAIKGFIENDPSIGRWTALNKNYERYFYKPDWALIQPPAEEV